jgi:hypothetical protein
VHCSVPACCCPPSFASHISTSAEYRRRAHPVSFHLSTKNYCRSAGVNRLYSSAGFVPTSHTRTSHTDSVGYHLNMGLEWYSDRSIVSQYCTNAACSGLGSRSRNSHRNWRLEDTTWPATGGSRRDVVVQECPMRSIGLCSMFVPWYVVLPLLNRPWSLGLCAKVRSRSGRRSAVCFISGMRL